VAELAGILCVCVCARERERERERERCIFCDKKSVMIPCIHDVLGTCRTYLVMNMIDGSRRSVEFHEAAL
jgi:hypothetical protein